MASGVAVNTKCIDVFNKIVTQRQHRCAVFKVNKEMTEILLEKTFNPGTSDVVKEWEEVTKTLPKDDSRYITCDFTYEHQGAQKQRLLFILWSPETSPVRSKMVYAASQEGFSNQLKGVQRSLQCMDEEDMEYGVIAKQLAQHTAGY